MATMPRILILAALLLFCSLGRAQYPLEIVPLRHRSVQEVTDRVDQQIASAGNATRVETRRVWLRVEALDN